jgi:hypothetical protein
VEVATGFVEAFGAFDAEQAITYLADGASLRMDATTPEQLPAFTSLLEAQGYKQILHPCEVTGSGPSGTQVRCPFDWHGIRSDQIGLGPYPGHWDLTVRDGEIAVVVLSWNHEKEFSPQMWEPFADWVSRNYPKDFDVMYVGGGSNFSLTEESIRLWEQHTREYVKELRQST